MNSIELHVDTTDVARPPLFEDLDEERPELLRLYRSWRDLAASGRLDDGDELQDMSAKRFQAPRSPDAVNFIPLERVGS